MAGLVALALAASLAPTVAGAAGATARAAGGTPASAAAAPGGFVADGVDGVRIHDRAVTARKAVTLSARPLTVAARWKLNEEQTGDKPATSPDEGSFGHDLTLAGDAYVDPQGGWVGNPPGALVLDGDGDYAATATPVIHTKQSFSVTGWVYTSGRPTHNAAIFSQEGSVNSAFTLRYAPDPSDPEEAGGYQIDIPDRDAAGATHQVANHGSFQSEGDWDHVAVVYDAPARQVRLYVNGELDQSVSTRDDTVTFDATGPFQIGRTKTDGQYGEYWPGMIDDVWAFSGVLSDTQIAQLAGGAELPTDQF